MWDVETGDLRFRLTDHTGGVYVVAFSPEEAIAVSCSEDSTVRLWNLVLNRELKVILEHEGQFTWWCSVPMDAR